MKNRVSISILFMSVIACSLLTHCTNSSKKKNVSETKKVINKEEVVPSKEEDKLKIVLKFYSKKDVGLGDEMCDSRLIVCLKPDVCSGIYTDCSNEYSLFSYFNGEKSGESFKGASQYFDNCGGSGEGPEMCQFDDKFELKFSSDSTKLTLNKVIYTLSNYSFKLTPMNTNLYESSSISSKVLIKNASGLKLKEIGSIEKQGGFWYMWLKVLSNKGEGWVLGWIDLN